MIDQAAHLVANMRELQGGWSPGIHPCHLSDLRLFARPHLIKAPHFLAALWVGSQAFDTGALEKYFRHMIQKLQRRTGPLPSQPSGEA